MHDNIDANRTNRQLLKSISTPVGRYYPLDLHVHSLGSYDVCQSDRYGRLPQQLRTDIEIAIEGTSIQLPLRKQPPDAGKHDQELASNSHLVNAYYKAILDLNQAFVERSARWFLNLESAHEQTTRKPGRELAAVVIGIGQRLSGVGRGGGTEASRLRLRGCFT
jgi:hypothetical protein